MMSRRNFLAGLAAGMLPSIGSWACSGIGPIYVPKLYLTNHGSLKKETTDEFLDRYLGMSQWQRDDAGLVTIAFPPHRVTRLRALFDLQRLVEQYPVESVEIIIERHIHAVAAPLQSLAISGVLMTRHQAAKYDFVTPGLVDKLTCDLTIGNRGRLICVARTKSDGSRNSRPIVTLSRPLIPYCEATRSLTLSVQQAQDSCNSIYSETNWSAHITKEHIESYVAACKRDVMIDRAL